MKKFSFCGALFKGVLAWKRDNLDNEYKGVKVCFYSCHYQNQNFSLVSQPCCSSSTRVTLVLH